MLSITDDCAVHSVPLNSQVIRVSEQGGETEYRLRQLPLKYKVDSLGGRLNIHDGKDRLIYCWRSIQQYQRRCRSPSLDRGGGRRSRSPRVRAPAGVEMMTPVSSRASAHMQLGTSRPQCSTTGTYPIPCIFRDRECSFSIASSPPFSNSREYDPGPRPDLTSNSLDNDSFKIKREDASVTINESIDLTKDEKDYLAPVMTEEEKKILLQITNNLMKTKTSRHFLKPVRDNPRYSMLMKEPMDLRTWKHKLIDGGYASIQEYKRDFRLIIDNALQWHEPDSEIAKDAQSLNAKFEEKMAKVSQTGTEDLDYKSTSNSSRPASPDSGPGDEPPRRTRELRPRAAKPSVQTYCSPSLPGVSLGSLGDLDWAHFADYMG